MSTIQFSQLLSDIKAQFTKPGDYNISITVKGFDGMNELKADDDKIITFTGQAHLTN